MPAPRHHRPSTTRPDVRSERGFTLVELLVGMTAALVVFTAMLGVLISGMDAQASIATRTYQLNGAQAAMQQLVRNLREATSVTVSSSSSITYSEPVSGGNESVTFTCSHTTKACTSTALGATQTVITNVTNTNVFTGSPATNPTYIGITLVVSATGENPVTLTDGAGLRNVTLGS
jgi:prepilin-type N-terminal cleavage/methylation domain-containing protein